MTEGSRLLAYARVSTTEQADSGLGIGAQRHNIEVWAQAHRVAPDSVHWFVDGGRSGSTMLSTGTPATTENPAPWRSPRRGRSWIACRGRCSTLPNSFNGRSGRGGRSSPLTSVSTSTPTGRLVAGVMASVAEWERATIGARTAEAMAQAKRRGRLPGRRSAVPRSVQHRLITMEAVGMTLQERADLLNADSLLP